MSEQTSYYWNVNRSVNRDMYIFRLMGLVSFRSIFLSEIYIFFGSGGFVTTLIVRIEKLRALYKIQLFEIHLS